MGGWGWQKWDQRRKRHWLQVDQILRYYYKQLKEYTIDSRYIMKGRINKPSKLMDGWAVWGRWTRRKGKNK